MKILILRTYQPVDFQKKLESFFSPALKQMEDVTMETIEWGIRIKTATDEVIISYANVCYAKPERFEALKAAKEVLNTHSKTLSKLKD